MTEVAPAHSLFIRESFDSRESVCKGMTCLQIPVTSTRAIALESAIKIWVSEPKRFRISGNSGGSNIRISESSDSIA